MDENLELVCNSLEKLADDVASRSNDSRLLVEFQGWNNPAITPKELSDIPRNLAKKIRDAKIEEISEEFESTLTDIPRKLKLLTNHTVAQLFNGGNVHQAIPAFMATIEWISTQINPLLDWQIMQDPKAMPPMLYKKLISTKNQLNDLSIDKDELNSQIELIQNATETAESLPADLISLKDARNKIAELSSKSEKESNRISEIKENLINYEEEIKEKIYLSEKLINQSEEAYRISTTKGLAGAFEERANRLSKSMWVWVFGLLCALSIGAFFGSGKLELLSATISAEKPDIGKIVMHSFLSFLSFGAPLWFAWLSTKQIGQRFKLSEDYAFKASVAKAYEGYRKEAARIDKDFEARLFSSALTRVEEPPLRLINDDSHGSPWHELIHSHEFRAALENIPEFRNKIVEIAKESLNTVKEVAINKNKEVTDSKNNEDTKK